MILKVDLIKELYEVELKRPKLLQLSQYNSYINDVQ